MTLRRESLLMKFKIFGLLLSSSLILAACSGGDETANEDTTETEGGPIVDGGTSGDDEQNSSTDTGGTEVDSATEENTPDDSKDDGEVVQQSGETTTGHPSSEGSQNNNTMGDNKSGDDNGNSNISTIALEDINLNTEDAISIAEGEAKGDIHEISFEQNGDGWVYKVDLNNGSEESEVVVNHDAEAVIDVRTEQEDDDDKDDQEDVIDYASLNTAYDALDKAIADLGGGEVKDWSLSMDDGVAEYNIDLIFENQAYEYTIDAETLEILESEQDD